MINSKDMVQENTLERQSRQSRDGAFFIGIGSIAIGSEFSPRLMLFGVLSVLGGVAFEGIRRLMREPSTKS